MDYLQWYYLALHSSTVSAGLVFVFSLFVKPKGPLKFISLLLLASFLADFIFLFWKYAFDEYVPFAENTPYTGFIYRLLELLFLSEFFKRILPKSLKASVYTMLQVALLATFISIVPHSSSALRLTNSILFTAGTIIYFHSVISHIKISDPGEEPLFYVNAGLLLYFIGAIFVFLFFGWLAKIDEISAVMISTVHLLFLGVKNILFAIGFWKARKLATSKGLA